MKAIMVAMDKNGVIGNNNDLPWHYKEDLAYFKRMTLGKTVLMGRKTFESIQRRLGKPLPKRHNVVLTRQNTLFEGAEVIHDIVEYLKTCRDNVFVIGGAQVFEAALPYVDYLYITHINATYKGDTYFPQYDKSAFEKISSRIEGPLEFAVYQRKDEHQ